jgi:hypothetical protein
MTEKRKPPNAGKGRVKGVPNKVTADVRKGFQELVESSVDEMRGWLTRVAKKDPARALTIVSNMAEYIMPKLARTEITGNDGKPVTVQVTPPDQAL